MPGLFRHHYLVRRTAPAETRFCLVSPSLFSLLSPVQLHCYCSGDSNLINNLCYLKVHIPCRPSPRAVPFRNRKKRLLLPAPSGGGYFTQQRPSPLCWH